MKQPIKVRLYRCRNCHTVQAFVVIEGTVEYSKTCPCGKQFGWDRIKVVD